MAGELQKNAHNHRALSTHLDQEKTLFQQALRTTIGASSFFQILDDQSFERISRPSIAMKIIIK